MTSDTFYLGVIEGFYGRQWSWSSRLAYADFLSEIGFDYYLYAPKGDVYLRKRWQDPWPQNDYLQLYQLSCHYHERGMKWGLGLSPLGLMAEFNDQTKRKLEQKVTAINALNVDVLCILFDDMPGHYSELAERQLTLVNIIANVSTAQKHIVCPSYYSFDPVLEKVFGPMPDHYLEDLAAGLDSEIDIFWTGDRVISPELPASSISHAAHLLNRKPVIWDNFLANDGKLTADYLTLSGIHGRDASLRKSAVGLLVNPMNQALLSSLPLAKFADVMSPGKTIPPPAFYDPSLMNLLERDMNLFKSHGLAAINTQQRLNLIDEYARIKSPVADEVCEWLAGKYHFDPECLTG